MRIEYDHVDLYEDDRVAKVEILGTPFRIVGVNDDQSYQVLAFTGDDYFLFTRVRFTGFDAHPDDEGIIHKRVSKEDWDSWGKDLPRGIGNESTNQSTGGRELPGDNCTE